MKFFPSSPKGIMPGICFITESSAPMVYFFFQFFHLMFSTPDSHRKGCSLRERIPGACHAQCCLQKSPPLFFLFLTLFLVQGNCCSLFPPICQPFSFTPPWPLLSAQLLEAQKHTFGQDEGPVSNTRSLSFQLHIPLTVQVTVFSIKV